MGVLSNSLTTLMAVNISFNCSILDRTRGITLIGSLHRITHVACVSTKKGICIDTCTNTSVHVCVKHLNT